MINITLPDGSQKIYPDGITGIDVAKSISERLAKSAIAFRCNDSLRDIYVPITGDCTIEIITEKTSEALEIYRHSCAHLMAQAVKELFPEARIAIGPTIKDGFYYDFDRDTPISEEDLGKIEERMAGIIKRNLPIRRQELTWQEAKAIFEQEKEPYKIELAEEKGKDTPVSIYRQGDFTDFCRGPHLPSTGYIKIGTYKLLSVAGAYWRGDEKNKQLQRIYATAFLSKKELDAYLNFLKEAKERDHRKIGKELKLFFMNPLSPASPFFLPRGTVIYNSLIELVRSLYREYGYDEVVTPQIFDVGLWKISGHYDHYMDNMFLCSTEEREFGVKPMNCPAHCLVFASDAHSYRDLPLRLADFGRLHRYERSGVTQGLTRVRSFSQDDAHIFCMPSQIDGEIKSLFEMVKRVYSLFGFDDLKTYFSTKPDDHIGSDEMWELAEKSLVESLDKINHPYTINPKDGAFYGPKIDFVVKDSIGREWQLATFQLDFNLPERFDLNYTDESGKPARVVMIHRAILGSIERFMGLLIEHFKGSLPFWLSPVQVVILPITEKQNDYADKVFSTLKNDGIRAIIDKRGERIGYKVRDWEMQKVPFMAVIGEKEAEASTIALRERKGGDRGQINLNEWLEILRNLRQNKSLEL